MLVDSTAERPGCQAAHGRANQREDRQRLGREAQQQSADEAEAPAEQDALPRGNHAVVDDEPSVLQPLDHGGMPEMSTA